MLLKAMGGDRNLALVKVMLQFCHEFAYDSARFSARLTEKDNTHLIW